MTADLMRFRLLLPTLSGWISRHQQDVIDYLLEENRVLKERLEGKPSASRMTSDVGWLPRPSQLIARH